MSDPPFASFYRALDPDVDEIRLLTTISVDAEGPVTCRLITVPIHECPPYVALSYVWGEATDLVPIQVDGQAFQATPSLARALRCVPRHWEARYPGREPTELRVWVDAVCINQRDLEERARQVRLMGSIFSGAELVMCWVQDAGVSEFSDYRASSEEDIQDHVLSTAFRTIDLVNRELRLVEQEVGVDALSDIGLGDERLVNWLAKYPELVETTPDFRWPNWNRNWEALFHLSSSQYWTRVWVFQEIVLAREALLICKSSYISLNDAVSRVWLWFDILQASSLSNPSFISPILWQALVSGDAVLRWNIALSVDSWRLRSMGTPEEPWPIFRKAVALTAADPKDKVYGMLGITGADLQPDYSDQRSVAEVFRDLAAAWLQSRASTKEDTADGAAESLLEELWFLRYAGLRHHCDHVSCQQFSSWAPNFPHYNHDNSDYLLLNNVDADCDVFSDEQRRTSSYIQGSSLFVTGLQVGWVHETYPHVGKVSDIFGFMSDLFRKEASEFSRVDCRRRLLRDLFELLIRNRLPDSTRNAQSDPTSFDYLESACAFVWAVLDAEAERERDCTANALSCIPPFDGASQCRTAIETIGLKSDTNAGFLLSLRETFLDLEVFPQQDLGERSGSNHDDGRLSWLQELMESAATGDMPKEGEFAARCNRIGEILTFELKDGALFRTSRGDFGLAPRKAINHGDLLCVLKGYSAMAALRETEDVFLFVGETKILGMMEGQAAQLLEEGLAEVRHFELK